MGITLFMLGMLGCVLISLTARMGRHELCDCFDGERAMPGSAIAESCE
jgi:hypothetical protein